MSQPPGLKQRNVGLAIFLVGCICGVSLFPGVGVAAGPGQPTRSGENTHFTAAAESGYERLGEDEYVSSALKFGFALPVPAPLCPENSPEGNCQTRFRAGVQAPLRLRTVDRGRENAGLVRREDWDETSDYLRTVRYIEYGRREEPVYGRIGELGAVSLGHGTIVNNYFNVVTPDRFRAGLSAEVDADRGGGSLLVNDVVQPQVVGGRAYVRPLRWLVPTSWVSKLSVGVSLVGDVSAPVSLRRTSTDQRVVGNEERPSVSERQGTAIGGVDLSLPVVDSERLQLVPYGDFNVHFGIGHGLHAGLLAETSLVGDLALAGRLEFRSLDERYLPDYFGPLYQVDRYQFLGWGLMLPRPKLRVAAERRRSSTMGGYGEVTARVEEKVAASVAYAGHEGPENSKVRLSFQVSPIRRVQFGLFYFKQNFDGASALFDRDGTFVVAESRGQIVGPLYAKASYGLLWRLREDGVYQPIHHWSAGAGVSFAF